MQTTATEVTNTRRAVFFARLTIVGVALYVIIDIIAQLLPPHYSPISQAESDLGVGPYGWVMSINFVLRGLVAVACVLALRSGLPARARSGLGEALLLLWGIGALILAFNATDLPGQHPTIHGLIHLAAAALAFVVGTLGEVMLSLRLGADPRLRALALVATLVAILAVLALGVLFLSLTSPLGGLVERVFIGLVLLWQVVVAARVQSLTPDA